MTIGNTRKSFTTIIITTTIITTTIIITIAIMIIIVIHPLRTISCTREADLSSTRRTDERMFDQQNNISRHWLPKIS